MIAGKFVHRFWPFIAGSRMSILGSVGALVAALLPPRTIKMATGSEGGAHYELGVR